MGVTILSPCSAFPLPSSVTPWPGDDQSVGSQKNPSLQSVHPFRNRLHRKYSRVTPRERSGQDRNSLNGLNWASSVGPPLAFVLLSLAHLREIN